MKLFVSLFFGTFFCGIAYGQLPSANFFETSSYLIKTDNLSTYFKGFSTTKSEPKTIRCVRDENVLDSIIFKLNNKAQIHLIEIKSKSKNLISDFKTSMSNEYTIYDEETMKVYFNKKRGIAFNFYSLGDYKIIEVYLNERLTLED